LGPILISVEDTEWSLKNTEKGNKN